MKETEQHQAGLVSVVVVLPDFNEEQVRLCLDLLSDLLAKEILEEGSWEA